MTLFSKHCPHCDSQDIFMQTYWTWDIQKQDWVSSDDDAITCADCGDISYKCVTKEVQEPRTEEQEQ